MSTNTGAPPPPTPRLAARRAEGRGCRGCAAMAETVVGTPFYMSPELFEEKPYSTKTDVWCAAPAAPAPADGAR